MNIFDFALKMEKDNEDLYRELGEKSKNEGIKKIFKMLADDEEKHYQVILKMKNNEDEIFLTDSEALENSTTIFQKARDNNEDINKERSVIEIYEKAKNFERDSQKYYEEKSKEVISEKQKSIFLKLAKEEEKHFLIMENLLIHVSRPERWVENAEFNPKEEY